MLSTVKRNVGRLAKRRAAMKAFAGIRRHRKDSTDSTAEVRRLRKGTRLERM
jgi:hypothetical protein